MSDDTFSDPLYDSTQWSRSRAPVAEPGSVRLLGLTVLYHPDLRRIGERATCASSATWSASS